MLKYEMVVKDLQSKIHGGVYKPNDQLPTISELCGIYGVSNITVKRALDEMVLLGLVSKRKGSGSYVKGIASRDLSQPLEMSGQMCGFRAEHEARGIDAESRVRDFSVVNPPADVAERLGCDAGDFAYHVCRTQVAGGVPEVVEYTYMPIDVIPGLRREHVEGSIYAYIEEELGLRIDSAHRAVRAVMPTEEERVWLEMDGRTPLLEVEQVGFLDDGRPFEYSRARHAGNRYTFYTVAVHQTPSDARDARP